MNCQFLIDYPKKKTGRKNVPMHFSVIIKSVSTWKLKLDIDIYTHPLSHTQKLKKFAFTRIQMLSHQHITAETSISGTKFLER